MPMREDCCHYESRTYDDGEVARFCTLDLAPEAPWRCPEACPSYERILMIASDFEEGSLAHQPPVEDEPDGPVESIVDVLADGFPVSLHAKNGAARWQPRSGYGWRVRRKRHHISLVPDTTVEAVTAKLCGYMDHLQMRDMPRVRPCGQILFHIHGCANELPIAEPMSWRRRVLHWLQVPAGQAGFAEGPMTDTSRAGRP